MREILFRGKSVHNDEWVHGYYIAKTDPLLNSKMHFILFQDSNSGFLTSLFSWNSVAPKTVGQFTGLTDKNGTKIFEGDILPIEDEIIAVVIFKDGCFRLEEYGLSGAWTESGFDECGGGWDIIECSPIDWYSTHDMEIIGNIHDNPELLEVE